MFACMLPKMGATGDPDHKRRSDRLAIFWLYFDQQPELQSRTLLGTRAAWPASMTKNL
jgi:hypothetical protein